MDNLAYMEEAEVGPRQWLQVLDPLTPSRWEQILRSPRQSTQLVKEHREFQLTRNKLFAALWDKGIPPGPEPCPDPEPDP